MDISKLGQGEGIDHPSVLTVDDESFILTALDRTLTAHGYRSFCSSTAADALGKIEKHSFDAMLCDLVMPVMSGIELLREVRQIAPDMVIIMMSGYADLPSVQEATTEGANDFLIKPFAPPVVPLTIERNLLMRQIAANRIIQQRNSVLLGSIKALSSALDAKEHGTGQHSERIASISLAIADMMGLSLVERSTLELAAYMHDIGKIGVSESVLLKPDKLSDEEWAEIKTHPDTGSRILSNIKELDDLARIIRHHHERIDGTGYPDELKGTDIPLLSRILSVADAYDAMVSDRPYRKGLSAAIAMERLKQAAGTQFDAEIVALFIGRGWREKKMAA